jgi:predicted RNA-binding Zn-ribbon protein involved in translation (DUF1610 family)
MKLDLACTSCTVPRIYDIPNEVGLYKPKCPICGTQQIIRVLTPRPNAINTSPDGQEPVLRVE